MTVVRGPGLEHAQPGGRRPLCEDLGSMLGSERPSPCASPSFITSALTGLEGILSWLSHGCELLEDSVLRFI